MFSSLFRKICRQEVTDVIQEVEKIILQGRELSQFTVDFIWYLRNLLMLSTDDHMAEMLDVSAENLIRMQEEAAPFLRSGTLRIDRGRMALPPEKFLISDAVIGALFET